MTDSEVETALSMMGARARSRSGRYQISCPLAPWLHGKGEDKNPSCSVLVSDKHGVSVFYCFTCKNKGSLRKLARMYGEHSGDTHAEDYVKSIEGETGFAKMKKGGDYETYRKVVGKKIKQDEATKPVVEEDLKPWMQFVPKYALKRGVTKEQINRWEIGYDIKDKRLIFTIRDWTGKFMGVSGRDLTGERKSKYKHYTGTKKELVLYGERFLDQMETRAYVVEGFFDVLGLERKGLKNALAVMGSSLSEYQMRKLGDWFKEVVFIPDGDFEGLKFNEIYSERLKAFVPKIGIAGVSKNPVFKERAKDGDKWVEENFMFRLNESLIDRDPDDLSKEELDDLLNKIEWI